MKPLPDQTRSWFGWREILAASKDMLGCYLDWHERGDAFLLRTGSLRHCLFYSPTAVGQVLKKHAARFVRYPLIMRVFAQWNGQSVLIQEGQQWLRTRRMLAPAFTPQHIHHYRDQMLEVSERLCAELAGETEVSQLTVALTLRVLAATIFGLNLEGQSLERLRHTIAELGEIGMVELFLPRPIPMWWPIPFARRKRRAIGLLKTFVEELVEERARAPRGDDLLSAMLAARDEHGGLSLNQVRDEAMTLMLAGHDTTAAGMSWLLYALASHPEVAERVAGGDLAYTEQVVRESLRLYPPAPALFLREAREDLEVDGYRVPRGALVHLPTFAIHRDPRWYPDPERFDPERFSPEASATRPDCSWIPFGGGPRICLGMAFALQEMILGVSVLLRHFRLTLPPQAPQGRELRVSLWPTRGLTVRLERR